MEFLLVLQLRYSQLSLNKHLYRDRGGRGVDTFLKRGALGAIPSGEEAVSCHKSGVI